MAGLNAGALNHEYTLQSPNCDSASPWSDVDTIWGSQKYVTGTTRFSDNVQQAVGQFEVLTYYRTDLDASWRLYEPETGRVLQIISFGDPDGNRESMRILCQEAQ